jgi:hypothetical protein
MNEAIRSFTRQVRPYARETVDSYSARLLKANFETEVQQRHLIRLVATDPTVAAKRKAWLTILEKRTGRSMDFLQPHPTAWLTHESGDGCDRCGDTLPNRWLCLLCTRGAEIAQNPHFDDIVCVRHSQWVGLRTKPGKQHPVGSELVAAEISFRKLKRKHRLDVQLFNALNEAVIESLDPMHEEERFVLVIRLAEAITDFQFSRRFFRPDHTYAETHAFLVDTILPIIGDRAQDVARGIWLNAMPTFWTIRNAIITGGTPHNVWAHDMPFPASIVNWAMDPKDLEPFEKFYATTGDDIISVAKFQGRGTSRAVVREAIDARLERHTELNICSAGHQFAAVPSAKSGWKKGQPATCPQCRHHVVQPGYNDLLTTHPQVAIEWDAERNGGYAPRDVTSSSTGDWFWRCEFDHSYLASLTNRTSGNAHCPYCQRRKVGIGINDLPTTHPELVAEWDPAQLASFPPTQVSAGSKRFAPWVCPKGHEYEARVSERVDGKECPFCERVRVRNSDYHLVLSHPALAAEWHPTFNRDLTPEERTAGSHDSVYWRCPKVERHWYRQRIDRRVAGYGCSICSKRTIVPGVNDLSTTDSTLLTEWHRYKNWKRPQEITAGTERYWWMCANKHEYQQSVPNRRKSKGCPKCSPADRILKREPNTV